MDAGGALSLAWTDLRCNRVDHRALTVIVTVWNVVVLDAWNKIDRFEKELILLMKDQPREMQIIAKRLIKRKKKKFADDPRAVGKHWVKEKNGELVFGCEARLDLEKVATEGMPH
ncbi:MAG: hypothetical protein AB2813_14660 [Candidatus Sedimenticola endophacoides]